VAHFTLGPTSVAVTSNTERHAAARP
jgi:hypothetical protein